MPAVMSLSSLERAVRSHQQKRGKQCRLQRNERVTPATAGRYGQGRRRFTHLS